MTQINEAQKQQWSQLLQRRIIRLLLLHNEPLFRNQFGHFFVQSTLPQIPLLQQYDRFIRLRVELLQKTPDNPGAGNHHRDSPDPPDEMDGNRDSDQ